MSGANAAADPSRTRTLHSWTSAATDDESTAADGAADPPAAFSAASASAAQSFSVTPKREKTHRHQLLSAAFGDQPPPSRWSDLSPAQRCFSDGLQLVFSFISLFELIPAARACRSWREAAMKANVPGVEVRNVVMDGLAAGRLDGWARLRSLASSPFRRHVHELVHDDDFETPTDDLLQPKWTLLDLTMLQHLPQLRRISRVRVELVTALPDADAALSFPPLLESADLYFEHSIPWGRLYSLGHSLSQSDQVRCVLRALRPCHSLTELSLTLLVRTAFCLDGLLELAALEILTIDIEQADGEMDQGDIHSMFTEEQMGVVKRLPNVRRLTLRDCLDPGDDDPDETGWMRWLCSLPHRLQQLQELDLSRFCLRVEHMQLLQRLPALTALGPATVHHSALPLLPSFASRLQRLELAFDTWEDEEEIDPELFDFETGFARGPLLLPHLTPCTALTHLTLRECVFSEADATALCQALSQLRDLDLDRVGWPSFESLRHLPLLESFSLWRADSHPLNIDAAHFPPLHQLWHLSLSNMSPLSAAVQSVIDALHPPSALLTGLVTFTYSP